MRNKRYVITGIGGICALGSNVNEIWDNIKNGVCGLKKLESIDTTGAYTNLGAEIKNGNYKFDLDNEALERMDNASLICLKSAYEAIENSKLDLLKEDSEKISVIIGSCTGGIRSTEKYHRDLLDKSKKTNKLDIVKIPLHNIARNISLALGVKGLTSNIANACAASNIAIAYGCDMIELGNADIVIVGGTDAMATLQFAGFHSLNALSKSICAPFSKSDGINLGEGAGILIIESYEHAKARNANMLCEIIGYSITNDAYHITAPRNDSSEQIVAMKNAIKFANIDSKEINYLNAHGTGTELNDRIEQLSIRAVFGDENKELVVGSTKAMTGHCLGAASAIEAIISIKAIQDNIIPPTINFDESVEQKFNFAANKCLKRNVSKVMSNAFAFGGSNSSVIFSEIRSDKNKLNNNISYDEKIVITGVGCVSSLGNSLEEYVKSVNENKIGIKKVLVDNKYKYASVADFDIDVKKYIPLKFNRRLDRLSRLLICSAIQSLNDRGIEVTKENMRDIGLVVGSSDGPVNEIREFEESVILEGIKSGNALVFPNTVYNASAGYLSILKNIRGYTATLINGIQSGIDSLCYGYDLLRLNSSKYMITSGYDEYNETIHSLYSELGLLYEKENLSELNNKLGFALGEGSATLFLEKESTAIKDNCKIYAEVAGYSIMNAPSIAGTISKNNVLKDNIIKACENSKVLIDDIDAIVCFGNGNKDMEQLEIDTYEEVFQNNLKDIELHYIKRLVGEGRASTSALQIIHSIALINNLIKIDKNSVICENFRNKSYGNILINSVSFSGGVSSIILKKYN